MTNVTDVMRNRGETTIEYNLCSRERVFAPLSLSSPLESQSNSRASPSASALGSRRRATYRVYHQLYPTRFVLPCGSLFLFLLVDVPVSHSPRSRKKTPRTSPPAPRTAPLRAHRHIHDTGAPHFPLWVHCTPVAVSLHCLQAAESQSGLGSS